MATKTTKRKIGKYVDRQKAVKRLKKSGLVFPEQVDIPPEFLNEDGNLIIPEDVSSLATADLARYLSIFTSLAAYYEVVVASADIDKSTAERVMDFVGAKLLLDDEISDNYSTVTEKKAARETDETYMRARDWYDEQKATYKMAEALLEGFDRIVFMLSREITRRGNTSSQQGRDEKVQNNDSDYQPEV